MIYNILDSTTTRQIGGCNFNQHTCTAHPDRIMDEHDLIYIREGRWSIVQDDIEYELVPGDVILLQGGHHHYGIHPCSSTVKTCFVHFSTHPDDHILATAVSSENTWTFPAVVHCAGNPMVEHYFRRMIYAYWEDDLYARKKTAAYLALLLSEISSTETFAGRNTMIDDIKLQIKTTPERFIGIAELAQKYHCSVRTISAKFKENTGCSLHTWQMRLKCQMADELIRYDPSRTLKELAASYGFYDEYHFGKCFKKIMGYSPKRAK